MSTVFYGYSIPKDQWWNYYEYLVKYYNEHYPIVELFKKKAEATSIDSLTAETVTLMERLSKNHEIKVQLFEFDDCYVFRVLESGYFYMNNYPEIKDGYDIETVYCDDRSKHPTDETWDSVVETVDKVDKLLSKGKYFVCYVVSAMYLETLYFDNLPKYT